jgi:hypothetical protein
MDILYKCKNCNSIITSENNMNNLFQEHFQILKDIPVEDDKKIIFFKNKKNILDGLQYALTQDKKFNCSSCKHLLGAYKFVKIKMNEFKLGLLNLNDVVAENIEFSINRSDSLKTINLQELDNLTLIKRINFFNEIISNYNKNVYRNEFIDFSDSLNKLQETLNKVVERDDKNQILLNSIFKG